MKPHPDDVTSAGTAKDKGIQKAGFLIHGLDRQGRRAMVAAYNEGRLGADRKAYLLPTGTVEPRERDNIIEAARRETFEETGIDVRELLGGQWYRFCKGEPLDFGPEGFESPSPYYQGIKVLKFSTVPQDFTYVSHAGVCKRTQLFEIEVDDIEALRENGLLKNKLNTLEGKSDGKVVKNTWKQIRKHPDNKPYPAFAEMLDWLRTGDMPLNRPWNEGQTVPPNLYEGSNDSLLFKSLEERHFGKGNPVKWSHEGWKEFLDTMESSDYKKLSKYFSKVKAELNRLGVTEGDEGIIKLDDKDFPLTFYQEGADEIPVEDYFFHALQYGLKNPYYNDAFMLNPTEEQKAKENPNSPMKSQLMALAERFPKEYEAALERHEKTMSSASFVDRLAMVRQLVERDAPAVC